MLSRKVANLPVNEKTVCATNADGNRVAIDRIIIHTMVGTAESANARFNNCSSVVSAHYGVLVTGGIWHWVNDDMVAYHAGNYAMNQRSIGIEHEDKGNYNGVRPDNLYNSSAELVADICKFYGIPCDRQHILKHSEVKATGCPDALDIDRIVMQAYLILHSSNSQSPSRSLSPSPSLSPSRSLSESPSLSPSPSVSPSASPEIPKPNFLSQLRDLVINFLRSIGVYDKKR